MEEKRDNVLAAVARRGFTLVEIMVVVAIIGMLAGLGVPAVMRHLEEARKTAAKSGVDTIKGAVTNYMIDKKKSTPPSDLKVLIEASGDEEPFLDGGEGALIDPWGREYTIKVTGKRFVIISAGPDENDESDDIRSDKIEKKKK